jgi:hypothetical protein
VGNAHVRSGTIQRSRSMSRIMKIQEVMETYQKLQTKMETRVWTDVLAEDDIKLLQDVEVMAGNLISQVYVFIDLFHQYIDLVQSAAIFSPDFVEPESNDANVYPTQTSATASPTPAPNRAERRAQDKKKTPFDVVKEKES